MSLHFHNFLWIPNIDSSKFVIKKEEKRIPKKRQAGKCVCLEKSFSIQRIFRREIYSQNREISMVHEN